MDEAREITNEEQPAVGIDRHARYAAVDLVIAPDLSRRGDVSFSCGVDAGQNTNALAVLRVLADRDIDAVFVQHRCRVDFTRAFRSRVFEFFPLRRITIVLPNRLEDRGVPFL